MNRNPLKRTKLPICYGNYDHQECHLCCVVTECMHETTGKSHREIIYMWDDLERIKKEIYPRLVEMGYIHPSNKIGHVPVIDALKILVEIVKQEKTPIK